MRLKAAYRLNREHSISRNISEFGAVPSNPDNTDAFAKAVIWLNAQTNPACLVFEPGIYSYETSPNWAVDYATITACGVVRLRNTGSGNGFILDGGAAGVGITGMNVGRFLIEGHKNSGDGAYIRALHRSVLDFNVRGCGTTKAGIRTEWCVVDEFRCVVSVNEGGWYNDGTGEAEPLYGVYLDDRSSGESTAYNTFINPILEGVGTGAYIDQAIGNQFYGGTMEACVTYGMQLTVNSLWNKIYGLDLEANGTADLYCQGLNNFFSGMDTGFASGEGIRVTTGAKNNQFIGGSHSDITIDSGAIGNLVSDLTVNRFGDASSFVNNGTETKCHNIYDFGNAIWLEQCKVPEISEVALTVYDAEPARSSEGNYHGGLQQLINGDPLNSGAPINLSKGTGKVLIIVNDAAPSGGLTITGTSVNRETGATTGADTDDIVIDAQTTDTSGTDGNSNIVHAFSGAYISSKWFTGSIAISTADLTLTDVDVYHVSFEQFNDTASYTLQTCDANLWTEHASAEFDCYLYALTVSGSKAEITREADLNIGNNGETAIANRYWRLRKGNIGKVMDGSSDGIWMDCFYSNSPVYIEDVTLKIWADLVI